MGDSSLQTTIHDNEGSKTSIKNTNLHELGTDVIVSDVQDLWAEHSAAVVHWKLNNTC